MWSSILILLVAVLCFSQSKPLEKESLSSSEKVFDGVLDKTVKCVEGGMWPYLSQLSDEDQEQWRAIGREGIRSYVERMRDFLKQRDESLYSDDDTDDDDYSSDESSEEYIDFIQIPRDIPSKESNDEHLIEGPKLTAERVEIEKIKRK